MTLEQLEHSLAREGLLLRGGFHPRSGDGVPAMASGTIPATLILVGNAGPAMWHRFAASPEYADGAPDPLDRWTRRTLSGLAADCGAAALFPFGGLPFLPFQRWALRAEPVHASPLGMLIHPTYGLWHAYRGALAFAQHLAVPARGDVASPCVSCAERPCLQACPAGAFSARGYDASACRSHLITAGQACFSAGCLARAACPVGRQYAYAPAQAAFHMRAFAGAC
jgi:hypothetical protein